MDTGVPRGATGPFPLRFGDSVGVAASERRGLPSGVALGLVELVAERLVLGHQIGDPLLQSGEDGAEGLVLLTELFDQRERLCQGVHVRGHDPTPQVDMTAQITAWVAKVNQLPRY